MESPNIVSEKGNFSLIIIYLYEIIAIRAFEERNAYCKGIKFLSKAYLPELK